ncbi:DUF3090 family protein [Anaerolineales bacterium HSG6]|nr:DUF3090 family protein [Anaerolineales bacterium HSG6]MDM8533041.1 DUF3090 family protein [Anaerolineales bacterium HSG25]
MAGEVLDFNPVTRITIGTIGPPGQRIFLLQAEKSLTNGITLKIEKEQARVLAASLIEFLDDLEEKYPQKFDKFNRPLSSDLMLREPMEPDFAVGQIGLGYDEENDMVVLVVQEIQLDEDDDNPVTARFWATRGQMSALSEHTLVVVKQGRPLCPLCKTPKNPTGQFCPRSNGHESLGSIPCPTG